jgi:hypothetical protein
LLSLLLRPQFGVLLLRREQAFLQVVYALMVVCDIFTMPNESKATWVAVVAEQSQQNVHGRCLCVQDYLDSMCLERVKGVRLLTQIRQQPL